MKKLFCFIVAIILLFSVALAESVTQMNYELMVDGESRIGKYTGNVKDGRPNGYGIFATTNPNGYSWHYIGNWQDGLMHGDGAIYWEDGSLEIGSYENGKFVFGYCNYDGSDLMLYVSESSEGEVQESTETPGETPAQYIGNRNSKVFHLPDCDSVKEMKEKNRVEFYSRDEAIKLHYTPCNRCKP